MDSRVETALRDLARREPDTAAAVRRAWDDLTAGSGDSRDVSQWWLQLSLWDQLARSSRGTAAEHARVAATIGDLLAAVGLGRYAEIARSPRTREILLSTDDLARYAELYAAALRASGIQPPDTALIGWGPVMGPAEADAYERAANALELAMISGDLVPGRRGAPSVRAAVTDAVLVAPQRDLAGQRPLHQIAAERLVEWADRSATLTGLVEPLTDELTSGVPEPLSGVAGSLEPLRRALVVVGGEAIEPGATPEAIALARRLGLVRLQSGDWALTGRGRRAAETPDALAAAVVAGWFGSRRTAETVAREVLSAALATHEVLDLEEVSALVRHVLEEDGWRVRGDAGDAARAVSVDPLGEALLLGLADPVPHGTSPEAAVRARPRPELRPLVVAALRHHLLHHGLAP